MSNREWGRLLTAMVTPFDSSLAVNYAEARRIAKHLVDDQKNDGIVVSGTTGESPTLSDVEKLTLLEHVIDEVGDRAAIVFGAGTYNTAESVHLAKEGEKRGADGVMFVNPYYSRPGQAGLVAHFTACANAVSVPVMLYNIMPRSAINLETPGLLELAKIPNIMAVKEASGNLAQISEVIRSKPEGFRVYSGDDALTLPIMALGGHGLVSVVSHICGAGYKEIIDCFETNPGRARELHHKFEPVVKAIFSHPSPVPIKYALSLRGFDCERVRLPLVQLTSEEKAKLDPLLKP